LDLKKDFFELKHQKPFDEKKKDVDESPPASRRFLEEEGES